MIVEPTSSFENRQATPAYYKKLRALAAEEGIAFVVDETKSGLGQSGKMWAHEHWWLMERDGGAPDIVSFGGKAGISGFYSSYDYRGDGGEQVVDMTKVLGYGLTQKEILNSNLLDLVQDTSSFLKIELGNIEKNMGTIGNIRGNGTHLAFDMVDTDTDSMLRWLQKRGVLVGRSGPKTLCVKPSLVLGPSQAKHLRNALKYYHPNHESKF